jgi:hypothetical protein
MLVYFKFATWLLYSLEFLKSLFKIVGFDTFIGELFDFIILFLNLIIFLFITIHEFWVWYPIVILNTWVFFNHKKLANKHLNILIVIRFISELKCQKFIEDPCKDFSLLSTYLGNCQFIFSFQNLFVLSLSISYFLTGPSCAIIK